MDFHHPWGFDPRELLGKERLANLKTEIPQVPFSHRIPIGIVLHGNKCISGCLTADWNGDHLGGRKLKLERLYHLHSSKAGLLMALAVRKSHWPVNAVRKYSRTEAEPVSLTPGSQGLAVPVLPSMLACALHVPVE